MNYKNNITSEINKNYEKALLLCNNSNLEETKKINLMKYLINRYNNKIKELNDPHNKFLKNNVTMNKSNNKSALLIGSNYYGSNYELNGCINDVNSIKNFLINKDFNNIVLLTDDNLNIQTSTKSNIIDGLIRILINSQSGDTIVLMYSGHGSYCLDENNDELRGYDQMIVSCDLKSIKDDELNSIIEKYLKKDVTLFCLFDSCYSGSVLDLKYQYLDSLNENKLTVNDKEKETRGTVIMISGCNDEQTSSDSYIDNKYSGAMTAAFLYCCNNIPQKYLTWKKILLGMRKYLKKNGYTQIPQLSSGKLIDINSTLCF
jgi:hypothetical protein